MTVLSDTTTGKWLASLEHAVRVNWTQTRLRPVVAGLLWIAVAAILVDVSRNPTKQADFRIYYRAAAEAARGLDPYVEESGTGYPFVYPPLTLHLFRPFTWLDQQTAQTLWFVLEVVALAVFLLCCHRSFATLTALSPGLMLFFGIGYNQAILLELRAGNIAIFEQTLLLAGLGFLAAGRTGLFVLAVLLAGQFKLTPWLFLILPMVVGAERWQFWVVAGMLGAAACAVANAAIYPVQWREFLVIAQSMDDRGMLNPSSFAFIRDALAWIAGRPLDAVEDLARVTYTAAAVAIIAVSVRAVVRHRTIWTTPDRLVLILFVSVVYGLVLPRYKNYSYILLLVPALDLIRRRLKLRQVPYSAVFVFFSVAGYGPLFGNLLTWFGYLDVLKRRPVETAVTSPGS